MYCERRGVNAFFVARDTLPSNFVPPSLESVFRPPNYDGHGYRHPRDTIVDCSNSRLSCSTGGLRATTGVVPRADRRGRLPIKHGFVESRPRQSAESRGFLEKRVKTESTNLACSLPRRPTPFLDYVVTRSWGRRARHRQLRDRTFRTPPAPPDVDLREPFSRTSRRGDPEGHIPALQLAGLLPMWCR